MLKGTGRVPRFHCPATERTALFGQIRYQQVRPEGTWQKFFLSPGSPGAQTRSEALFDSTFLLCLSSPAGSDPRRGSSGSNETPSDNACEWGWGDVSHSALLPPTPRRRPAKPQGAGREPEDETPQGVGADLQRNGARALMKPCPKFTS